MVLGGTSSGPFDRSVTDHDNVEQKVEEDVQDVDRFLRCCGFCNECSVLIEITNYKSEKGYHLQGLIRST